jgi:hypothetical protein
VKRENRSGSALLLQAGSVKSFSHI